MLSKKTIFERGNCPTGRGNSIEWVHVHNPFSRGLIFLPPLIGGNVSQQIGMFRWLFRKGYNLLSFSYSGHGNSENKFSLGATLRDTNKMLRYAIRLTDNRSIPLFGIAPCYSAIPLIHSAAHLDEPFQRIVLINAVLRLKPAAIAKSFFDYYRRILHPGSRMKKSLTAAAKSYLDFLFPNIRKGKNYFGILERRRIDLLKTLADIMTLDPLQYVTLRKTSVLCLYASNDKILHVYDKGVKTNYRNDVRKVCPRTQFAPLDGDHFLSPLKNKKTATRQIRDFLQGGP